MKKRWNSLSTWLFALHEPIVCQQRLVDLFLVDKQGILETRNKEVKLRLLNTVRVGNEKLKWQFINLVFPIVLILALGFGYSYYRKKRYVA